MRGFYAFFTFISLVATCFAKPPGAVGVGELEKANEGLRSQLAESQKNLNQSQMNLNQTQMNLNQYKEDFTTLMKLLKKLPADDDSTVSDQVQENTKQLKLLNPVCSLQRKGVCGKCNCRDDSRLDKKFYCNCINLGPKRDCKDHMENGNGISGVYHISPNYQNMHVFCDQEDAGGGWTVFQRRMDGSVNFYRNWEEYRQGFGALQHEHWLGNDHLWLMSVEALFPDGSELKVDMEDFNGAKRYARYSTFEVGSRQTFYTLNVGGYSGNAGDSLAYSNRASFTTYDQSHGGGSCAIGDNNFNGAWWYKSCSYSNLNAEKYYYVHNMKGCEGIFWNGFTGGCGKRTLKNTVMKMRRK